MVNSAASNREDLRKRTWEEGERSHEGTARTAAGRRDSRALSARAASATDGVSRVRIDYRSVSALPASSSAGCSHCRVRYGEEALGTPVAVRSYKSCAVVSIASAESGRVTVPSTRRLALGGQPYRKLQANQSATPAPVLDSGMRAWGFIAQHSLHKRHKHRYWPCQILRVLLADLVQAVVAPLF